MDANPHPYGSFLWWAARINASGKPGMIAVGCQECLGLRSCKGCDELVIEYALRLTPREATHIGHDQFEAKYAASVRAGPA